jgi:hypothetical protein
LTSPKQSKLPTSPNPFAPIRNSLIPFSTLSIHSQFLSASTCISWL